MTAAVIERDGRYLVTRRLRGTHLAGFWEFPGGKCDTGEPLAACLEREIAEELDTNVRIGAEIHHVAHEYPERIVELHFFRCELLGEPRRGPGAGNALGRARRARIARVSAGRCGADCDARAWEPRIDDLTPRRRW